MEGTLLKWTNYWNGWQPRWFVLKDGVLSYYNSQNDTNSGCKRSFKISMFDIIVNRTDSTRMDLIVANDQHLYLKACDYRERQKWLVAIATQKASYPNSTNEQQYVYQSSNLLKCKQSELRLYCDLLMQQIHEMKNLVNTEQMPTNEAKKMDEISSNVNVTCEMLMNIVKNIIIIFENQNQHQLTNNINGVTVHQSGNNNINTLKELLNDFHPNQQQPPAAAASIDDSTKSSTTSIHQDDKERLLFKHHRNSSSSLVTATTATALIHNLSKHLAANSSTKLLGNDVATTVAALNSSSTHKRNLSSTSTTSSYASASATISKPLITAIVSNGQTEEEQEEEEEREMKKTSEHQHQHHHHNTNHHHNHHKHGHHAHSDYYHRSFFTNLDYKFEQFVFINDDQIPTEEFLNCVRDLFKILDIFGATTFLPVKVDVAGNISKISTKFQTDVKKYHTLQTIVQSEIDENQTTVKNSATDALLWLKRGLWFLREFFYSFIKPNSDISGCIQNSYSKTLKQYHNWVVRGIFSLALRSIPNKENFYIALALDQSDIYNNPVEFEAEVCNEISRILINVDKILNTLNTLYTTNKLDENNPVFND